MALYLSIPHAEGLASIRKALDRRVDKSVSTDFLMEMLEFVLTNNYFGFRSEMYRQIEGTAIGTKMAPPYACIFMDGLEKDFLASLIYKPLWWKRFIDDIIKLWIHGERRLREFILALNSFHPSIKFTFAIARDTVDPSYFEDIPEVTLTLGKTTNYMDLNVWIHDRLVRSDLYCKPTDCHQYLSYHSCHPYHVKKAIIYGQALRVRTICSSREDFESHTVDMKSWFLEREYPSRLINEQIDRARRADMGRTRREPRKDQGPVLVARLTKSY